MNRRETWIVGAVACMICLVFSHFRSTPYNNYVLLADAFVHGHVWITWPGPYIDALPYRGQHYIIEAPAPALLLVPFVAAFGTGVNQTSLACILAGVATSAAWTVTVRIGVSRTARIWLGAFFLLGTGLAWCAMLGDVWFLALVASVCFSMLALAEVVGQRRAWLVALWAVCAVESRFSLVLALPIYAVLVMFGPGLGEGANLRTLRAKAAGFAAVLIPAALLWVWYNFARWGLPIDIGYTAWYHQDSAGMPTGSPFRFAYLPYQLNSFFVQHPAFSRAFPWIVPSFSGVALTWTSPAFAYAFAGFTAKRLAAAMWIATILVAAPSFLYYVNGYAQYGMRHALDFMPFLFVLMAIAARNGIPVWARALIAYSCVAWLYGMWYWNGVVRAGS